MDALGALRALADRVRDWRLNPDHNDIEDECANWAELLLSRHTEVDVIGFVLDDIENYLALRIARASALRVRQDLEQDADRLAGNSFGQLQSVFLGLVMAEPEYGRQYLSGRVEADERIDTAIRLQKRYEPPETTA